MAAEGVRRGVPVTFVAEHLSDSDVAVELRGMETRASRAKKTIHLEWTPATILITLLAIVVIGIGLQYIIKHGIKGADIISKVGLGLTGFGILSILFFALYAYLSTRDRFNRIDSDLSRYKSTKQVDLLRLMGDYLASQKNKQKLIAMLEKCSDAQVQECAVELLNRRSSQIKASLLVDILLSPTIFGKLNDQENILINALLEKMRCNIDARSPIVDAHLIEFFKKDTFRLKMEKFVAGAVHLTVDSPERRLLGHLASLAYHNLIVVNPKLAAGMLIYSSLNVEERAAIFRENLDLLPRFLEGFATLENNADTDQTIHALARLPIQHLQRFLERNVSLLSKVFEFISPDNLVNRDHRIWFGNHLPTQLSAIPLRLWNEHPEVLAIRVINEKDINVNILSPFLILMSPQSRARFLEALPRDEKTKPIFQMLLKNYVNGKIQNSSREEFRLIIKFFTAEDLGLEFLLFDKQKDLANGFAARLMDQMDQMSLGEYKKIFRKFKPDFIKV